jgi:hypothetical protein
MMPTVTAETEEVPAAVAVATAVSTAASAESIYRCKS